MSRKRLVSVWMVSILLVTGCSANAYESYTKAAAKTDEVTSGKFQFEMELNTENQENQEGMPEKMTIQSLYTFANNGKEGILDVHVFNGTMGFDFKYFIKTPEEHYLKLPHSEVYYLNALTDVQATFDKAVFENLNEKWIGLLKSENIFSMEDRLIATENGDVKAKVYSVRPTSDQIRTLKEWFIEALKSNTEWASYIGGEANANRFMEAIEKVNIVSYEEEASVDFDGYIIEETVKLGLDYSDTTLPIKQQQVLITKKYLERNTKVSLDFGPIESGKVEPIESLTKGEK